MWWSQAARGRQDESGTSARARWARANAHRASSLAGILTGILVGGALVSGCFGKVADTREEDDGQSDRSVTPVLQDNGSGASQPGGGDDFPWGSEVVDACDRASGFSPAAANGRSCNWMTQGLCFEDKERACACACGTGGLCLSGFPEEGGGVEVWCD